MLFRSVRDNDTDAGVACKAVNDLYNTCASSLKQWREIRCEIHIVGDDALEQGDDFQLPM